MIEPVRIGGEYGRSLLDADEARACIEMWQTGRLDTFDIAQALDVPEDAVARTIQAYRDVALELLREVRRDERN